MSRFWIFYLLGLLSMVRMRLLLLLALPASVALAHVSLAPPSTTTARGELLLYFPGSGVASDDRMHAALIDHAALTLGFHVIVLDYPNWPTVTKACRTGPASCCLAVREQRLWGGGDVAEVAAGIPQFKRRSSPHSGGADSSSSTARRMSPPGRRLWWQGTRRAVGWLCLWGKRTLVWGS